MPTSGGGWAVSVASAWSHLDRTWKSDYGAAVSERPTGTVTFLFTDVEGSTELLRRLREEYAGALATHQRLVREAVGDHGGIEIDTQGDAFFFVFQRASDAVRAAIDAQRALGEYEWPDAEMVHVRMGLHTGSVRIEDGRYHGLSVHRAARISSAAHGGQILLSESTRSLLADEEEVGGIGFRDLGQLALKDFDRPIRIYRIAAPGLRDVSLRPRVRAARRRRRLVWAGALAVLACALVVALLTTFAGSHSPLRAPMNSVAIVEPTSDRVSSAVSAGDAPDSIAIDPSAAWVANHGSSTITRIDVRTHATSTIGGFQSGLDQLTVGAGGLWATERTAGLASVDVPTLTASPPVPLLSPARLPYSAEAIAYGSRALWIGGGLANRLVLLRVDPATDRIVARAAVGVRSLHAISVGEGGVWVSDLLANEVVEFDPTTLRRVRRIDVGGPTAIALGGGSLWVCGTVDNAVWRLDERGGYHSRHLIPVGRNPVALAYGEGAAWAALGDGTLVRIDAHTNAVRRTKIAPVLNGVAVGDRAVWAEVGPVNFL